MATTSETGLEPPRSVTPGDASDLTGVSAAAGSQKRGRGRPPKPKSGSQPNGAVPARKPSGRPKRNRDPAAAVPTAVVRRGRGRPKRSNTLSPTESLVERSRKRGRPKKDDVAGAPAKKRGRKPKSEQVAKRSVGRPKKVTNFFLLLISSLSLVLNVVCLLVCNNFEICVFGQYILSKFCCNNVEM